MMLEVPSTDTDLAAIQKDASSNIFGIEELLANILLHVSFYDLFFCRRVSKSFQRAIHGSIHLRRILFLQSDTEQGDSYWVARAKNGNFLFRLRARISHFAIGAVLTNHKLPILHPFYGVVSKQPYLLNPLILTLSPKEKIESGLRIGEETLCSRTVEMKFLPPELHDPDYRPKRDLDLEIYRRMLVTKPAMTTLWMRWRCDDKHRDLLVFNEKGVTYGDIVDEIHWYVRLNTRYGELVQLWRFELSIPGGVFLMQGDEERAAALLED